MSAALAATVGELPDEDDGGKLRAATADDYASIQYRLAPRDGSRPTPSFDKTCIVNVRAGLWESLPCKMLVLEPLLMGQQPYKRFRCSCSAHGHIELEKLQNPTPLA